LALSFLKRGREGMRGVSPSKRKSQGSPELSFFLIFPLWVTDDLLGSTMRREEGEARGPLTETVLLI
jgi:hypothetical protein